VASKTGTQGLNATDNSDAWMVGYTPSVSTAVWMGSQGLQPITNAQGKIIYGSGLPGQIWQEFMDSVLEGTPKEQLPSKAIIKGDTGKGVAEETTRAPAATTTAQAPATSSQAPRQTTTPAPSFNRPTPSFNRPTPVPTPTTAAPTTSEPQSAPTCGAAGLPVCPPPEGGDTNN
jgi:membrane peptidoglycan carboxypeptidase